MTCTFITINGDDEFLKERAALEEASRTLSSEILQFRFPQDLPRYVEFLDITTSKKDTETAIVWGATEIPRLPDDGLVILVAAKGKTLQSVGAKRSVDAKKPKAYDDVGFLRWVIAEGDRFNIDLRQVASSLFVNCGTGLRKLHSEVKKLKILADPDGKVSPSAAKSVLCFSAELTPKCVVDSICEGHPAKAIAFYDKLQERACETGWIIAYLQRHVLQQLRIELLKSGGMPVEKISTVLELHPTFFRNAIMPRIGLWSVASLSESYETLCGLDIQHKRGIDVSRWGLESEIIRLSEEAKRNVARRGS